MDVQETKGQYGKSRILTLERNGAKTKVWVCSRMIMETDDILRSRWSTLKLVNYGMAKAKKSRHDNLNFEVVV